MLEVSSKNPIYVYFVLRSPHGSGLGQVSESPVKIYTKLDKLYTDIHKGLFNFLEDNDPTDSYMKRQSPCSYDGYIIFIDGDTSSKYKGKHERLIRIPRPYKKITQE